MATEASGSIPRYVGAMRLAPLVERYAVDAFVVVLGASWLGWAATDGAGWTVAIAALLGTVPLLLRRRFPFAAPVLVFAGLAGVSLADPATAADGGILTPFSGLALALAFWVVGSHPKAEQAIAGAAIGLASVIALAWGAGQDVVVTDANSDLGAIGILLVAVGVFAAAFAERRRAQGAAELEKRAVRLEHEREARTRAAAAAERARIADDLHDVIAHSVSVMTVQATAARLLLDEDPQRARGPLLSVEETGRQALADVRRLLGLLRADAEEAAQAPSRS